jgi:hypothetical protein
MFRKRCSQCGHRNPAGSEYCNACGSSLREPRRSAGCFTRVLLTISVIVLALYAWFYVLPEVGLRTPGEGIFLGGRDDPTVTPELTATLEETPAPLEDEPDEPVDSEGLPAGQHMVTYFVAGSGQQAAVQFSLAGDQVTSIMVDLPWELPCTLSDGDMAGVVARSLDEHPLLAQVWVDAALATDSTSAAPPYIAECGVLLPLE